MSLVQQLCTECQKERKLFSEHGNKHSPGCTGLWRLAFSKDQEAWNCIHAIFTPLIRNLCRAGIDQSPAMYGLSQRDLNDIVQDIWHNIWRYAARNSSAALDLVAHNDLSRLIGVMKETTKNRILELGRKSTGNERPLQGDDSQDGEDNKSGLGKPPKVDPPEPETILDILALLKRHIQTIKEYVIAEMIFLQGMKPQDVLDLHPEYFKDVGDVNQTRQTLIRRIRTDPARPKPGSSASLEFRLTLDEGSMQEKENRFEPCPFDEGILVDYINGHVSAEVRTAIERSPVCIQAVVALKTDLEEWRSSLRQMFCPTDERLLAYQEHRLTGADYLVVHKHVQHCPYCTAEVRMLAAIDAVSTEPQPSLVRRVYQLFFQPATMAPVALLGEGSYRTLGRTPQIELLIRTTRSTGKQDNWMVIGRVRYEGDQPIAQVATIILQDLDVEDAPELSTTVDENGTFTFKRLDAGKYRVRILTSEEELILHELKVGDDL
jgi:hypothetical protein